MYVSLHVLPLKINLCFCRWWWCPSPSSFSSNTSRFQSGSCVQKQYRRREHSARRARLLASSCPSSMSSTASGSVERQSPRALSVALIDIVLVEAVVDGVVSSEKRMKRFPVGKTPQRCRGMSITSELLSLSLSVSVCLCLFVTQSLSLSLHIV